MDYFYAMNTADLTPLKTELVDLVSSCLMKEPPFEAVRPDQVALYISKRSNASWQPQQGKPPTNDGVAAVMQMRELVHLISRQDGEFVLKLALYTRRTLHLRSSPNYLVALCAREPNCIPFLDPYMDKIVMIPSDWLAIANFAYFYDCDAAHDFSNLLEQHAAVAADRDKEAEDEGGAADAATRRASGGPARLPPTNAYTPVNPGGSPVSHTTSSTRHDGLSPECKNRSKKEKKGKEADSTRSYVPTALRSSLVRCFAKFTPFNLSKYNNEAAEHRARRKARKLLKKQEERTVGTWGGDSNDEGSSSSFGSVSDNGDEEEKGENAQAADAPRRHRKLTFTYKSLIRKLHITQPAFLVCCLLGKKYPTNEKVFKEMGLHQTDPTWKPVPSMDFKVNLTKFKVSSGADVASSTTKTETLENGGASLQPYCIFNHALSGTRMRLPVVLTWETLLSKEGNTGKVWDALVASRAVGYMALLRNLRNILTRTCSKATHKLVLERLVDEQQVALSQQLPYRFYSAYLAVKEVQGMINMLAYPEPPPLASKAERGKKSSGRGGRGRSGRGSARGVGLGCGRVAPDSSVQSATPLDDRVRAAYAAFENPIASRRFTFRYIPLYMTALDSAINTAARLNIIPMKGTSIVVLCLTEALFKPMSATGGEAETTSIQRKIDVAALLIAMMMHGCEQCVVLLYCYDEYVMFHEEDNKTCGVDVCSTLGSDNESSSSCNSGDSKSQSEAPRDGAEGLHFTFEAKTTESSTIDPLENSRAQQKWPRHSFIRLVEALVMESTVLLQRKMFDAEGRPTTRVKTSFDMFADGSGARFPYDFLDEVIERNMRVESLLVFDEGVHRTYADMNPNAPAFGDLPTYLSRLRRVCSPDLVYVGVNIRASNPPLLQQQEQQQRGAPGNSGAKRALQQAAVKARFRHHNDILLTGFSDTILRLVAERMGGGPLSLIERAAETYQVARFSARANQDALGERAKALKIVSALCEDYNFYRSKGRTSTTTKKTEGMVETKEDGTTTATADTPGFPAARVSTARRKTCMLSAATTVSLPSFDTNGKVMNSATWEADWGHKARRSERQLQQLTSSFAGLSSSPHFAIYPSSASSQSGTDYVTMQGPATLPSIRRLFTKRSTVDSEDSHLACRSGSSDGSGVGLQTPSEDGGFYLQQHCSPAAGGQGDNAADSEEAAWLALQGKRVSPIYHPQPFISLVKLLSASETSASEPASTEGGTSTKNTVNTLRRKLEHGSRVPSLSVSAGLQRSHSSGATTSGEVTQQEHQMCELAVSLDSPQSTSPRKEAESSPIASPNGQQKAIKTKATLGTAAAGGAIATQTPFGVVRRLLTSYRVCRFFISSTFLDMNNERNAITLDVFPRLRRWAAEAGLKVTLLEVDLRWGIPAVATTRNLSTSVCLNEVSRCSPFFLGMIGARYGSCPPTPLQLVVDEDVAAEDFDWMSELTDPHVSVTELEMRHAMYNTPRRLGPAATPTALFFAREYDHLMSTLDAADAAARRVYESDSATAAESITALKQRIVASGYKLIPYKAGYTKMTSAEAAVLAASAGSGCNNGDENRSVEGNSNVVVSTSANGSNSGGSVKRSSMRTMLEDDLGRWAVRGGCALDVVGPSSHTVGSKSKDSDSLWSFVKARINESEEPRLLTSMDVPLDMSDFSARVFWALQEVIQQVCGVRVNKSSSETVTEGKAQSDAERVNSNKKGNATEERNLQDSSAAAAVAFPNAPASPGAAPDLYETLIVAQSEYARKLSALYTAPRGVLEQLSSFVVAGTLGAMSVSTPAGATGTKEGENGSSRGFGRRSYSPANDSMHCDYSCARDISITRDSFPSLGGKQSDDVINAATSANDDASGTTIWISERSESSSKRINGNNAYIRQSGNGSCELTITRRADTGSILLVEGCDGDGKSSTLAALMERVLRPMHKAAAVTDARPFIFYSMQAGDDSARSLLYFLAMSYRTIFHLYAEMSVHESDPVEQLLLALEQTYASLHRRCELSDGGSNSNDNKGGGGAEIATSGPAALVVILDGLDKSSESAELLSLLGTVLHPLAAPHIRFVVSACPRSGLANALRSRTPAALVVQLPLLSEGERAQLVRLHLAAYGKLLEESFSVDELKELLRKSGAGRPSRLIAIITYLRLFSTFDTLREDIRSLPATATQLYVKFFTQLQSRFDGPTCRLILTLLCLRHPVGGVMEYNLYRLVSNVAVASRLVALLRGICLDSHHGRLFITSAAFVAAVAHTYFPFASDYQSAQERVLVAELLYQPVDMTVDEQEVRQLLRRTREAIERNAADPLVLCRFNPERYAPRELLGVLQGSVQAGRLDVTATLVCYLPFLECLVINRRMLPQLIGLLLSILHATKRPSASVFGEDTLSTIVGSAGETGLINDADAVTSFGVECLPLHWRQYRNEVRRISNVLDFLQTHYHILLQQPSLLRQCVWNALARGSCVSTYDCALTARLRSFLQQTSTAAASAHTATHPSTEGHKRGNNAGNGEAASSSALSFPNAAALSALWVHWVNLRQHGGETRVQLTTASSQAIRCMAISPDGSEVALGGDDGFVRRICTGEEEGALPATQLNGAQATKKSNDKTSTGNRSRLASTLRHESPVAAVTYVPQSANGPGANGSTTSGFIGRGLGGGDDTGFSSSFFTPAPQLLVSGCVRGIIYVWNLKDNSLLQRGTGHLRSISGLVCHPLEPSVLCTCSHDSYVMLWNLCGSASQLSEEVASAIALRLPKYPANSPERFKQQRMLNSIIGGNSNTSGNGTDRDCGSAVAYQSSLASRSIAAHPDYLTPLTPFHIERQHRTPVSCIDFHRTGDVMASGSWDGALLLYNTRELRSPPPVLPPASTTSKPRSWVGQRNSKKKLKQLKWRTRHGAEYRQVTFLSVEFDLGSPVRSLSFSSSLAVTCVVGCYNGAVVVVDYASRAVVARWTSLHTAPVTRVLASPDSRCVASADEHGVVRLTHLGVSGVVFATLNGHHGAVTGLGFRVQFDAPIEALQTPQQVLLTAGEDRTLQAWRVNHNSTDSGGAEAQATKRCLPTSHSTAVTAMAMSADGQTLVTGSADGIAIVFCALEEESHVNGEESLRGVFGGGGAEGTALGPGNLRDYAAYRNRSASASFLESSPVSVREHSATRAMEPSFVLRHDDCRITCIRFALQDTKIVVGVVFGLVYVWSAAPGLNHIEGRLLLRVRVPEHGLYPIISIGVWESNAGAGAAAGASTSSPELLREVSEPLLSDDLFTITRKDTIKKAVRGLDASFAGAAATAAAVEDSCSDFVTAICANGDVAVLKLLSDTASRVMAADQERRCNQRRLRRGDALQRQRTDSFSSARSELALFNATAGTSGSLYSRSNGEEGEEKGEVMGDALFSPNVDVRSQLMSFPAGNHDAAASAPSAVPVRTSEHLILPYKVLARRSQGVPLSELPSALQANPMPTLVPSVLVPSKKQMLQRKALDRRAVRLQRLLGRCRVTETELRANFQLNLCRHRLSWSNSADAEEIVAVVWLSGEIVANTVVGDAAQRHDEQQQRQQRFTDASKTPAAVVVRSGGVNRYEKLALIVTQRKVCLMLSSRHESAVSGELNIRVSHHTPDAAALLRNGSLMLEKGASTATEAAGKDKLGVEINNEAVSVNASQRKVQLPATNNTLEHDLLRDLEVDVSYLLSDEEYFTAASAAVAVGTGHPKMNTVPSLIALTAHLNNESKEATSGEAALQTQTRTNAFVVALTTSGGEVLLLRVHVPHLHRRDAYPHSTAPFNTVLAKKTEGNLATATPNVGGSSPALHQLREHVLPLTQLYLCQRLSFTKAAPLASLEGAVGGVDVGVGNWKSSSAEAMAVPAAAQRAFITPLVTAVQLCALPDMLIEPKTDTHTFNDTNDKGDGADCFSSASVDATEQVALVAGCSDGSTRIWIVPTMPLTMRTEHWTVSHANGGAFKVAASRLTDTSAVSRTSLSTVRASDVPISCFFCSSAVSVASPLLQVGPTAQRRQQRQQQHTLSHAWQQPTRLLTAPRPWWVVGDTLGDVYQLQLERGAPGGVTALMRCSTMSHDEQHGVHISPSSPAWKTQGSDCSSGSTNRAVMKGLVVSAAAGGTETRPWVSTQRKLIGMMDQFPSTEVLEDLPMSHSSTATTMLTGSASMTNNSVMITSSGSNGKTTWWSMSATQTPADWLNPVDFSVPVAATLLKRGSCSASPVVTRSACIAGETQRLEQPPSCGTRLRACENTHSGLSHGAANSSLLSSFPSQESTILSSLPTALRAPSSIAASLFPNTDLTFSQSLNVTQKADEACEVNCSTLNPLPPPPAVLPSFGSEQVQQWQQQHNLVSRTTSDGEAEVHFNFETPLLDVLSTYRRNAQVSEPGLSAENELAGQPNLFPKTSALQDQQKCVAAAVNAVPLSKHQKRLLPSATSFFSTRVVKEDIEVKPAASTPQEKAANAPTTGTKVLLPTLAVSPSNTTCTQPTVRFALSPSATPCAPVPISMGNPEGNKAVSRGSVLDTNSAITQSATASVENRSAMENEVDEDKKEEGYFGILYKTGPPPQLLTSPLNSTSAADVKRAWFLQQQEVLKEATRVQQYNEEARTALRAYQERMASAVGMQ